MSRIAYLTSRYPAPSHTFIRREIEALRARGLIILPFSVREGEADAREDVPSILGQGGLSCGLAALFCFVTAPARTFQTWALAQRQCAPGVRGWLWAQFHFVEALVFARMLRSVGAERIHSHFANSGATVGMLAAHWLRIPWSLTLHGISETDYPAGVLLPLKLARADFVACASWFMRAQAMRVAPPKDWPKFHVVRCGIDFTSLPAPQAPRMRGSIRFVCVGRLSAEKGHAGLIQAFHEVCRAGLRATLTLVGDGPLRGDVEEQIKGLGLGELVQLRGARPEQATLAEIQQADILVLPSLMEGLPVVLMEASALGKPVIAPAVAGIPELITDSLTGLLFRPSDWQQLAECMIKISAQEAACREMGERGRARVIAEFEINNAVQPLDWLFSAGKAPLQLLAEQATC